MTVSDAGTCSSERAAVGGMVPSQGLRGVVEVIDSVVFGTGRVGCMDVDVDG